MNVGEEFSRELDEELDTDKTVDADGTGQNEHERRLRRIAKARAGFKHHLLVFLVIDAFLWALNYFTQAGDAVISWWAVWPTLGWGVAVLLHAVRTYAGLDDGTQEEREYERLRRKYDR